jgi:hypothetical protein
MATRSSLMLTAGTGANGLPSILRNSRTIAVEKGFKAFKLGPFGTAKGFVDRADVELAFDILYHL